MCEWGGKDAIDIEIDLHGSQLNQRCVLAEGIPLSVEESDEIGLLPVSREEPMKHDISNHHNCTITYQ